MKKLLYISLIFIYFICISCDRFLPLKKYEISYSNGCKDTIMAVSANKEGYFINFKGKNGESLGLYSISNLVNYKVIEYK